MRSRLQFAHHGLRLCGCWIAACGDSPRTSLDEPAPVASDTKSSAGAPATTAAATVRRYPDACDERQPSRSKPCSDDPDPCQINSGFPGDEYCLLPPPQGQGIQLHVGPANYHDPAEVERYVLAPGQELNSYGFVNIPITTDKLYAYVKISMRPGSHHLINYVLPTRHDEGFIEGRWNCEAQAVASFPGTQNLVTELPPQGIPAPENVGIGYKLPAGSSLCHNYHRYNFTDQPTLSEIWYNIWFVDAAQVDRQDEVFVINAGPHKPIPAHTQRVLSATRIVESDGRITALLGHRHVTTERFATWLNDQLVYDSWDWVEARTFYYDSISENPAPNPKRRSDGAATGILTVKRGDKLKIECHVNNTNDHALPFANELYTGEMCILYASTVDAEISPY